MNAEHVELRCPCGRRHRVDVTPDAGDQRGPLVALAEGWGPLRAGTLANWARTGRLRAFRGARGQLLAWEADIRTAVEAERVEVALVDRTEEADLGLLLDPCLERVT